MAELAAPGENALATGPFGSSISSRYFQSYGVPVIRGSNLTDTVGERLVENGLVFLSPEKAEEFSRSTVRRGDLIFTCWGTIGQVGLIDDRAKYDSYIVSNKQMKLTPNPDIADSLFLYYSFSGPAILAQIRNQAIGSSVPGFNLGQLKSIRLRLPPLSNQRAIAHILGTLDDKIELNRRMNETVEAMARELFQSWFVDFDPVRARAAGSQPPGMDPTTAALFPSEFQNSEFGSIPKGWDVKTLSKLSSYLQRGISPKYADQGGVLVLNQKCVRGGAINSALGRRHDTEKKGIDGRELQLWDVLINSTGVGTLGRVGQIRELSEVTIVDSHVTIVRAALGAATPHFLGTYLLRAEPEIEALGEGSTGQTELSRSRLGAISLVAPPLNVQEAFDGLVLPLRLRQAANQRETRVLATLRDALLPRLLSGELSVGEAMKSVEARA